MPRLDRPQPQTANGALPVTRDSDPDRAARDLRDGRTLVVRDHFATGVQILRALDALLEPVDPAASHAERQDRQRTGRQIALRLLAPVRGHAIDLRGANANELLAELYPELPNFHLPLVQLQELHGAWVRHRDGLHLAVLGHRIHPFYGAYAPTRTEHLELFATWLQGWSGPRERAVDVGTGCGVLALLLARAGFEHVLATDTNPNAIESLRRELVRHPTPAIEPLHGDLLGPGDAPVDMVVFNPPWTPGPVHDALDSALFYEPDLFPRFFDRALERLAPDGRIVLLFSTIGTLVRPDLPHPIQAELDRGRLVQVQHLQRRVKPARDADGTRRRTRERVEVWELAKAP